MRNPIPKELNKDINKLENTSNRILIRSLFLAIILCGGFVIRQEQKHSDELTQERAGCREEREKMKRENDSLKVVIIKKTDYENQRLREKDERDEMIKNALQQEIKLELKRRK